MDYLDCHVARATGCLIDADSNTQERQGRSFPDLTWLQGVSARVSADQDSEVGA
ncbi:hypothetical protein [Coleofasciculus sp. G2-EDA-02]|uniref:hypothetical protein n=1 Tax=Coleofasciculus sp. G2-EDA-02 TaxID=3069529 RepID=UPI0032FF35AB